MDTEDEEKKKKEEEQKRNWQIIQEMAKKTELARMPIDDIKPPWIKEALPMSEEDYLELEKVRNSHAIKDHDLAKKHSDKLDKLYSMKRSFSDYVYNLKMNELADEFNAEIKNWEVQKEKEIEEKEQNIFAKLKSQENMEEKERHIQKREVESTEKKIDKDWENLREKQKAELEKLMYDTFKQFSEDTRGLDGVKAEELPYHIIENLDMSRDSIQRMAIRHYLELYDFDKNPIFDKVMDEERQYLKSPEYNQIRETQKKLDEQEKRLKSIKERDDSYNQNEETERIRQKMIKMQQNKRALDRDNTDELR